MSYSISGLPVLLPRRVELFEDIGHIFVQRKVFRGAPDPWFDVSDTLSRVVGGRVKPASLKQAARLKRS